MRGQSERDSEKEEAGKRMMGVRQGRSGKEGAAGGKEKGHEIYSTLSSKLWKSEPISSSAAIKSVT